MIERTNSFRSTRSSAAVVGRPGMLSKPKEVLMLVAAVLLGIGVGATVLATRDRPLTSRQLDYLAYPGKLLLNMLNLLLLPLVVSSIVSGLTMSDVWAVGRLGLRAATYFLGANLLASLQGTLVALGLIRFKTRGSGDASTGTYRVRRLGAADTVFDLIRQMFPSNIVESTFQRTFTVLKPKEGAPGSNNGTGVIEEEELVPVLTPVRGINILGLIVMSAAGGVVINLLEDKGLPLKVFFDAVYQVIFGFLKLVSWYMPFGVLFLVIKDVLSFHDAEDLLRETNFFIIVIVSLMIHGLGTLPAIYFLVCKKNPYKHLRRQLETALVALTTSSSLASLPINMRNLKRKSLVDPRVVNFMASLGSCVNKDGTALYLAISAVHLGDEIGISTTFSDVLIIWLMSVLAAVVTPGVPKGGLITMAIVLQSVGIPRDMIGDILVVDWLLDRFRTVMNVLSDSYGCVVVEHLSKSDLQRVDPEAHSLDSMGF